MKNIKKILVITLCVAIVWCLTGCMGNGGASQSSKTENAYTEELMNKAFDSVGLPNISNYFERSQLKSIYELRDDPNLICYWYTKNQMSGKWVFEGSCLGYGIPYGASMTASDKAEWKRYKEYASATTEQAEPNGIYTKSVTSSATWVLTVDSDGSITPTYVEQEISVRQKSNKIDASKCEEWSIPDIY